MNNTWRSPARLVIALGKARALGNLGIAYDSLGQYERAIDFYEQHLAIAREIGDRAGEGRALGNLGNAYYNLGQYDRALEQYGQAVALFNN
jgi:tetratricopeptide (TPR) repeat protein